MDDFTKRLAIRHLDQFTKVYCRDRTVKDDLVFRCEECEFAKDDICLAKRMAKRLCPDYKDFGCMGDL